MLLELRVVLVEFAHARLAMKDLTVVTVRKDIARHKMEHVKVYMYFTISILCNSAFYCTKCLLSALQLC